MTVPPATSGFLSAVKGFTPVIDVLAQETGYATAAVYGVVQRYCQMEEGVCKASVASIAKRLGMHPKTARRHLKKLCQLGYLEDTTPDLRNLPHVYRDTGEAKIIALVQLRAAGSVLEPNVHDPKSPVESALDTAAPGGTRGSNQNEGLMPPRTNTMRDEMPHQGDTVPHQEDKMPDHGRTDCPPKKEKEDSNKDKRDSASAACRETRRSTTPVTSRHPAIRVFRSNAHRYPAKSWFSDVARTVGEKPDNLTFWGHVVKAWVGSGYNPTNVRGMLDWFRRGQIPVTSQSTTDQGTPRRAQTNLHRSIEAGVRLLQKEGEWPP
jgi:hypothetical protein